MSLGILVILILMVFYMLKVLLISIGMKSKMMDIGEYFGNFIRVMIVVIIVMIMLRML